MGRKGVFFNIPGHGHVNPTLAVVQTLVERGEQIDYYCTEAFRETIEHTGARFVPLPNELVSEDIFEPFHLIRFFAKLLEDSEQLMPFLVEAVEQTSYDYVLADWFTPWGRFVAEQFELPIINIVATFALHQQLRSPLAFKGQYLYTPIKSIRYGWRLGRCYSRLKKNYNLPHNSPFDYLMGVASSPTIVFTARDLQPQAELFPAHYHFTGPNIDTRLRPKATDFPLEKLKERTVVYISLGSVLSDATFYQKCIRALADTNYLVVLNIGQQLSANDFDIPSNFIVCNYVPQLDVLPFTDIFVTHGGMNSAHEGLYFEVPLVVVPQVSDQFLVAQAVVDKGLGYWLNSSWASPSKLRQTIDQCLQTPPITTNVKKIATALQKAGGPNKAATLIQQFLQAALS